MDPGPTSSTAVAAGDDDAATPGSGPGTEDTPIADNVAGDAAIFKSSIAVPSAREGDRGLSNTMSGSCILMTSCLMMLLFQLPQGLAVTCQEGEYQIDDWCCPKCRPGHRVTVDCYEYDENTSCEPCEEGTFMDEPTGRTKCSTCAQCDKGSGLKVKTPCSNISDTVCEAQPGFYCVKKRRNVSCLHARPHTHCAAGQFIKRAGTALKDSECSDCSSGTFSDGTFSVCHKHTQCKSQGRTLIKTGTNSTDAECQQDYTKTVFVAVALVAAAAVVFAAAAAGVVAAVAYGSMCLKWI